MRPTDHRLRTAVSTASLAALVTLIPGCSGGAPSSSPNSARPASRAVSTPADGRPPGTKSATHRARPSSPARSSTGSLPVSHETAPHRVSGLPLRFDTADAGEVVTVTAASTTSTTGTLQAWRKLPGGWRRAGPAVPAYLGSDGLTTHASESRSATPMGSFTLTRAFGHDANPGTRLPYTQTTPADWWISQPGPLYNTRQRCSSGCSFTQGDPNEHLYYETPYYDYAVVIDYNTRNAPGGVQPGAGSAFFLHVTVHQPTQGCVSIDANQLVRLLRWLDPDDHPRILIGLAG